MDIQGDFVSRGFDPDSVAPEDLAMANHDRSAMIRTARMTDDEYAAHLAAQRCECEGDLSSQQRHHAFNVQFCECSCHGEPFDDNGWASHDNYYR